MNLSRTLAPLAATLAAVFTLSACSQGSTARPALDPQNWDSVLAEARGQTVDWYHYGGDTALNSVIDGLVTDRLDELGVTLRPVRVNDAADVVSKVIGEVDGGRSTDGSVDAIWINGENFAGGKEQGLWWCDWAESLPNARYLDLDDPALRTDFGTPVEGCEAPWQSASSGFVFNSTAPELSAVTSIDDLVAWIKEHPGRFTYPAAPDFTGSMVVRTFLYGQIGGPSALPATFDEDAYAPVAARLMAELEALEPFLWRQGKTYPTSQEDLERLYADGEIDGFFTYGPGNVAARIDDGVFPGTTQSTVLAPGNIANTSFVTIPANAADRAGALVLADVLTDPEVQLALYRANGAFPVVDLALVPAATAEKFGDLRPDPNLLSLEELSAGALPELAPQYLARLEKDWTSQVLRR